MKLVAENPGNIASWITDHDGNIRVATTTDGVNTSLLYRKTENDPWKTVITTNFKESFSPQFFTFDNKALYGVSNIGRDKSAIVEFDPETGKETKSCSNNRKWTSPGLNYSRKRKVITSATYTTWKEERKFFDPEFEALYKNLPKNCRVTTFTLSLPTKRKTCSSFEQLPTGPWERFTSMMRNPVT